ncbi:F-box-like protein isoform X2 [Tasmannia lanceolata]|uniref:F-box-like protein isoform X2 n=1 Tax=Tasmannia lanceolata TaxID=3420 RepID=UPI0040645DFD
MWPSRSLHSFRWPSFDLSKPFPPLSDSNDQDMETFSYDNAWRSFYIKWHKVMAGRATTVVKFVNQCSQYESLEVANYLRAIGDLCSVELGFKDVQLFLFTTKQNVLLNLIGLHYCLFSLGIPAEDVTKALSNGQILQRQVCVRWWKLGRWFHGFRLRDETHFRRVSLGELATAKEEEVMGVLHRGAIHEVLRVQISSNLATTTWVRIHSQG